MKRSAAQEGHVYYHPDVPQGHRLRDDLPQCADYYPWRGDPHSDERESQMTDVTCRTGVFQHEMPGEKNSLCEEARRLKIWNRRPEIIALFEQLSLLRSLAPSAGNPSIARAVRPTPESQSQQPSSKQSRYMATGGQQSALSLQLNLVKCTPSASSAFYENLSRVDYPLSDFREIPSRSPMNVLVGTFCDKAVPLDRALWMIKVSANHKASDGRYSKNTLMNSFGKVLVETTNEKLRSNAVSVQHVLYLSRLIAHCYFEGIVEPGTFEEEFRNATERRTRTSSLNNMDVQTFVWAVVFQEYLPEFVRVCSIRNIAALRKQLMLIRRCLSYHLNSSTLSVYRAYDSAIKKCALLAYPVPNKQQPVRPSFSYIVGALDSLHSLSKNDIHLVSAEFISFVDDPKSCEQFIQRLCEWAVTDYRAHFVYRPCLVLALLQRLAFLYVDQQSKQAQQQRAHSGYQNQPKHSPYGHNQQKQQQQQRPKTQLNVSPQEISKKARELFEQQLLLFLRTFIPRTDSEMNSVVTLFATLIRGGVFCQYVYVRHLISFGLLQPWNKSPDKTIMYHRKLLESLPVSFAFSHCNDEQSVERYREEKNQRASVLMSINPRWNSSCAPVTKKDIESCVSLLQRVVGFSASELPDIVVQTIKRFSQKDDTGRCFSYNRYWLCEWACSRCLPEQCACKHLSSGNNDPILSSCCCNPTPSTFRFFVELCNAANSPCTVVDMVLRAFRHRTCSKTPELLGEVLSVTKAHAIVFVRLGCLGKLLAAMASFQVGDGISGADSYKSRALLAEMRTLYFELNRRYGFVTEVKQACEEIGNIHATWSAAPGSLFVDLNSSNISPKLVSAVDSISTKRKPLEPSELKAAQDVIAEEASQLPLLCAQLMGKIGDDDVVNNVFYNFVMQLGSFRSSILPLLFMRESMMKAAKQFFPLSRYRVQFLLRLTPHIISALDMLQRIVIPSLDKLTKSGPASKIVDDVEQHVSTFLLLADNSSMPWSLSLHLFLALAHFFRRDDPSTPIQHCESISRFIASKRFGCMLCSHPSLFLNALIDASVRDEDKWGVMHDALSSLFNISEAGQSTIITTDKLLTSIFQDIDQKRWCSSFVSHGLSFLHKSDHFPYFLVYRFAVLLRNISSGAPETNGMDAQGVLEVLCHIIKSVSSARQTLVSLFSGVVQSYQSKCSSSCLPSLGSLVIECTRDILLGANSEYAEILKSDAKHDDTEMEDGGDDLGEEEETDRVEETLLFGDAFANLLSDSITPSDLNDPIRKNLLILMSFLRDEMRRLPRLLPADPQPPQKGQMLPSVRMIQAHLLSLLQIFRHAYLCLSQSLPHNDETVETLIEVLSTRVVQADHEQVLYEVVRLLRTMISTSNNEADAESILAHIRDESHIRGDKRPPVIFMEAVRLAFEQEHVQIASPHAFEVVRDTATAANAHAPEAFRRAFTSPWQVIPEIYDVRSVFQCRVHRGELIYGPHALHRPKQSSFSSQQNVQQVPQQQRSMQQNQMHMHM